MPDTFLDIKVSIGLLIGFGLLWIWLGRVWGRKARDLEGFMVAGRNVGFALGAATAVATWITSNTTMLAPQFALQLGVWGMLAYCTASFGLFLFAPLARRIRALMPRGFTSVEFFRLRYGPTAHIIFLLISLFYALTWLVSMAMAAGLLLETLGGIPYHYGMTAILLICVLYTLFGGLYAVIGTDFIQSVVILIGLVVVTVAVLNHVSVDDIHTQLTESRPALLWIAFPAALMALFNNLLFGLGEVFHSNVWWSRAFAMRKNVGAKAYFTAGLLWLPIPIVAGFLGLAAPALGLEIARPDVAGPAVAAHVLGVSGAILIFVVVLSSLASSIDSLLAATADLITHDIVKAWFIPNASSATERKIAGASIVGLGLLTWLICLPNLGTLATVLFFAGPLVGSAIWPVLLGLFSERANPKAVIAALLFGSFGGLWAYMTLGWYTGALVGTAISMVICITGTLMFPASFDWARLQTTPQRKAES